MPRSQAAPAADAALREHEHALVRARRRFTTAEYHRMADAGVLGEDDRVELLDGEIVAMSPIGSRHSGTVNRLNMLFAQRLDSRAIVSVQNPIVLDDYSEPQPDLAILAARADYYVGAHPRPADVLLAIEVMETSGCPAGGTDLNGDGDAADAVAAVNALPGATPASWVSLGQAADTLALGGATVALLTSEAAQGDAPLNADANATDRVLQVLDADSAALRPCTPSPGTSCAPGVRNAAEELVMGPQAITNCGTRQLIAFRTSEAAEGGTNLNGGSGVPADTDTADAVLQVYDAVTQTLKNTGQAAVRVALPWQELGAILERS